MLIPITEHPEHFTALTGAVLVACLTRGPGFLDQLALLQDVSGRWARFLRTLILVGEGLDAFPRELGLAGTPSYLLYLDGRERGRRLGQLDTVQLDDMLRCVCGKDPEP